MLVRVEAPHFVAGLVVCDGVVTTTAPILSWAKGKQEIEVLAYFRRKNYKVYLYNRNEHKNTT